MPKKPPVLSVVTDDKPKRTFPAPPRKLGPAGRALFDRVMREYQMVDTAGIEILTVACQALDRAESLRALIDRDGELIKTRTGALKAHPALRDEIANRAFFVRCIARLGLDIEPLQPMAGRPGKGLGIEWTDDE